MIKDRGLVRSDTLLALIQAHTLHVSLKAYWNCRRRASVSAAPNGDEKEEPKSPRVFNTDHQGHYSH